MLLTFNSPITLTEFRKRTRLREGKNYDEYKRALLSEILVRDPSFLSYPLLLSYVYDIDGYTVQVTKVDLVMSF